LRQIKSKGEAAQNKMEKEERNWETRVMTIESEGRREARLETVLSTFPTRNL